MTKRRFHILSQNAVDLWIHQASIEADGPAEAARIYAEELFSVKVAIVRLSGLSGQSGLFRAESYSPGSDPEEGTWLPLARPFFVM